jgi:hypothetical protein
MNLTGFLKSYLSLARHIRLFFKINFINLRFNRMPWSDLILNFQVFMRMEIRRVRQLKAGLKEYR